MFPNNFVFFLALSLAHLITSYFPQTFFSVPTPENIMHLFPLHRMFNQGKAGFGIFLCLLGSFFGGMLSILLLPFLFLLFSSLTGFSYFVSFAIIFVFLSFIFSEKSFKQKIIVLFIFLCASLFGVLLLSYNFFVKEPLFLGVMGLFTFPMLLKTIFEKNKSRIKQEVSSSYTQPLKSSFLNSLVGSLASLLIILVPSFSSSQASTLITRIKKNLSTKQYLLIFSSITISSLIFSYFLAMFFYKPRIGYFAILLSNSLILQKQELFLFIVTVIISVSFTVLLLNIFLKDIICFFNKISLNKINIFIFVFFILLCVYVSGFFAIPVLLLGTAIGFLPLEFNKSRVILMGFIMFPTLLLYI